VNIPLIKKILTGFAIFLAVTLSIVLIRNRFFPAKLNLSSNGSFNITADTKDSMGVAANTQFTITSDTDIDEAALKNSLVIFPEVEYSIKAISSKQFSVTPKQVLAANKIYKIVIKSTDKDYSWAFQTQNPFRVVQTFPRDKSVGIPLNSGVEFVFSHDNWEDPKDLITIIPKVTGRFERHKRTISFVPDSFNPSTLYTVKLKKGLKLTGTSEILNEDYTFQFETAGTMGQQYQLTLNKFYEFSTSDTPAFDIYSQNGQYTDITANVYKFPSEAKFIESFNSRLAVPSWAYNTNQKYQVATDSLTKVSSFTTSIQLQTYKNYFLTPEPLPVGQYLIEVVSGNQKTQAHFQVTNVSAYFTESGNKTLAWVNDTATGKPLAGAKVSLYGNSAETDSSGVAYFNTNPEDLQKSSTIVTISHSNGNLFIPLIDQFNWADSKKYQNDTRERDKYWSYLYLDRPSYLSDDTVKFWGLLKARENGKKLDLVLEVSRTDYMSGNYEPVTLFTKNISTGDSGTFLSELPLKNYAPGWYTMDLKLNGNSILTSGFSVENYVKPAYKISLNPSTRAVITGDNVNIQGDASFYEGTPVVGLALKTTSYNNGNSQNFSTDNSGKFSFTKSFAVDQQGSYSPQFKSISVSPVNPEEGAVNSDLSIAIFDSSFYLSYPEIEVKDGQGNVSLGIHKVEPQKYSSGVDIKNIFDKVSGKEVKVIAYETEWKKKQVGTYYDFINKISIPRYEYDQIENKLSESVLSSNDQGKVVFTIPVPKDKTYKIKFESTDEQGRITSQTAYLSNGAGNDTQEYLSLRTSKSGNKAFQFTVGEQVNLNVYKGENKLVPTANDQFLFIISQRGIRSFHLSKDGSLSFKFPEEFKPNIFVQAIRFTGKTYRDTENAYLYFDKETKKISFSFITDKPQYEPGDTAKLTVITKDASNNPISSEVNINLIDEAYYSLYPEYANPLDSVYRSLGHDILASYKSHQYPIDSGGAEGGGCFLAGTEILMSDGKAKNIEEVKEGDIIKTRTSIQNSKLVDAKVQKTFSHTVSGYLLINNTLRVTSEHNLYINGRWLTAGQARVGDSYLGLDNQYHKIITVENRAGFYKVYNFTVEGQHTYFANGFYVHNEKGGSLFRDNAFFGTLVTNSQGKGTVAIKLPDNLTSWRITSQAISEDLHVGIDNFPLVVKLPFFIIATLNTEYLAGDNPTVFVRAFGDNLSAGDDVSVKVSSPTISINKTYTGKAFQSLEIGLGKLPFGTHKLIFEGSSSKGSYKLERIIKVFDSRLKITKTDYQILVPETKLVGSPDSNTIVIFSDENIGKFYNSLVTLASSWGDRLDQKLARSVSSELINKYFDESYEIEEIKFNTFQIQDGGLAIYPYASSDPEVTAFVAAITGSKLDQSALKSYFYKTLSDAKDTLTISKALFGIASLNEPVLLEINSLVEDQKLEPETQIYLGLALAQIGDTERARSLYQTVLKKYQKSESGIMFISVDNNKDTVLLHTALMADLGSILKEPEAESFLSYINNNSSKDLLLSSQKILALQHLLKNTSPQDSSFTYSLNGKDKNVKLEKGKTIKLILNPEDLASLKFSNIGGKVSGLTSYKAAIDASTQTSTAVSVSRSYSVGGALTNHFGLADLVKVTLNYSRAEVSQDGCFQVTDIAPSGLRPITNLYNFNIPPDNQRVYPYEIDGQKVSFCVYSNSPRQIYYYARVVNGGAFKAEDALIQSLISPSVFNLSGSSDVSIK
jgi:hypothetical protein